MQKKLFVNFAILRPTAKKRYLQKFDPDSYSFSGAKIWEHMKHVLNVADEVRIVCHGIVLVLSVIFCPAIARWATISNCNSVSCQ